MIPSVSVVKYLRGITEYVVQCYIVYDQTTTQQQHRTEYNLL